MRIAVLGASGALAGPVLEALRDDPERRVDHVIAFASRLPADPIEGVDWRVSQSGSDDLHPHLGDVDAVVNLSMAAPEAILEAVGEAGIGHLVQASSFAAYAPAGPRHDPVDETWPRDGVADVPLARRAVALERALDAHAEVHPATRVVRIRSGIVLGPAAAAQLRRRLGPLGGYVRTPGRIPLVPGIEGASLPAVHHDDLALAYRAAVTTSAAGAFNVALDEPLELAAAARSLGGRPVAIPNELVRAGAAVADRLFSMAATVRRSADPLGSPLGGSPGEWLALARSAPRLATWRARKELGWQPRHHLAEALSETLTPRG